MKRIYHIIIVVTSIFCACQADENLVGGETGYLRLSVNEDRGTNTRAVPADYDPEQIAVQIVDAENKVIEETEDAELWKGEAIELPVGTYTIKASSNGFDGKDAGFEIPYYTGNKEIKITKGAELKETVTCTLANVKVSAIYAQDLVDKVQSIALQVYDEDKAYSLNFSQTDKKAAYFPVVDALYADITIVNKEGKSNSLKAQKLCNTAGTVQARDHYILNLRLQSSGSSNINVSVNPETHEYSYTFNVSTVPSENATLTAKAWDRLAYLKATDVVAGSGVSLEEGLQFQYRTVASGEKGTWTKVDAVKEAEGVYTALATGLTASTEYQYQLVNKGEAAIGDVKTFETGIKDTLAVLQNAGFEDWYKAGKVWYAASQSVYNAGDYMWDSSNPGSGKYNINPTTQSTDVKHTGASSAKLETQYAYVKLATASLYYGRFNGLVELSGAKIDFGQSFTSRPVTFKGWYQYKPVAINKVGGNQPTNTVKEGDIDLCSIYIILAKDKHQVDNTKTNTLLTKENVWNDDNFIAYGELPANQCVDTDGQWKEFTIPLQYKENVFGEQPKYLIIVCSSSKYGDYFTGGVGSTLYVDDFSLVYEGTPTIWKNK